MHGNGPQVGLLALQSNDPFDMLVAESQGMIGYVLQQSLNCVLQNKKIAITVLTQVEVNADDPAFYCATKPIGPYYSETEKLKLEQEHGWGFVKREQQFRRVVASPKPQKIIELNAIKLLSDSAHLVIAAGGGGIPCVSVENGLQGIEAVIDKDLTAARLALDLQADKFIILTDVEGVYRDWGTKTSALISQTYSHELKQENFESGSMAPKIQAACQFVENSGCIAAIGHLEKLTAIMNGQSGTIIAALK